MHVKIGLVILINQIIVILNFLIIYWLSLICYLQTNRKQEIGN